MCLLIQCSPMANRIRAFHRYYIVNYGGFNSHFINAEIMKVGYAQVMTVPPNVKYAELFLKLQKEARDNKRGLWK